MIGIIDYGMGNLRSVQKAFEEVGAAARILPGPPDAAEAGRLQKLVLPGVGAFGDGMTNLRARGWVESIRTFIDSGRPFLGVCLGLQLLFEGSEEDAPGAGQLVPGLGVLPGKVVRFCPAGPKAEATAQDVRLRMQEPARRAKVPHMGWNTLKWTRADPLLAGLEQEASVYFVHSYYAQPREDGGEILASAAAPYPPGQMFCASVWRGNVWATQFHPEKSQTVGLHMLRNFANF